MDHKNAKIAYVLPIFLGGPMAAIQPLWPIFQPVFRVAMTWHEHADTQNSDTTRHGNY